MWISNNRHLGAPNHEYFLDDFHVENFELKRAAVRLTAYFVANETGTYSFNVSCAKRCQLRIRRSDVTILTERFSSSHNKSTR